MADAFITGHIMTAYVSIVNTNLLLGLYISFLFIFPCLFFLFQVQIVNSLCYISIFIFAGYARVTLVFSWNKHADFQLFKYITEYFELTGFSFLWQKYSAYSQCTCFLLCHKDSKYDSSEEALQ